jgi:hypothetical protein
MWDDNMGGQHAKTIWDEKMGQQHKNDNMQCQHEIQQNEMIT